MRVCVQIPSTHIKTCNPRAGEADKHISGTHWPASLDNLWVKDLGLPQKTKIESDLEDMQHWLLASTMTRGLSRGIESLRSTWPRETLSWDKKKEKERFQTHTELDMSVQYIATEFSWSFKFSWATWTPLQPKWVGGASNRTDTVLEMPPFLLLMSTDGHWQDPLFHEGLPQGCSP